MTQDILVVIFALLSVASVLWAYVHMRDYPRTSESE